MPSADPVCGVLTATLASPSGVNDQPTTHVKVLEAGSSVHMEHIVVSAYSFNNDDWTSSDLGARIGIPLKIKPGKSTQLPPGHNIYSRMINGFFANVDTSSDDFGKYMHPPLFGAAIIVREDGRPLGKDFDLIVELVQEFVCGLLHAPGGDTIKPEARELMPRFFEPTLFQTFWGIHAMIKAGEATDKDEQKMWMALKAPKPVKQEVECAKCGAKHGEDKKLMKCGGCKTTEYCGKECQVADRPAHKDYCFGIQLISKMPFANK